MANIHGLSDSRNQNRPGQAGGMGAFNMSGPGNPFTSHQRTNNVPFLNNTQPQGDPRKESMLDMCRLTCCPNLNLKSFTVIITIVDITFYLATLVFGGIVVPSPTLLTPKPDTLSTFGNRNPYYIRHNLQLWRLLTPVFLHANFVHIFFNILSQLIIGSQIENIIGTVKMAIVYFVCAIGGNLFGAIVSDAQAVGASTAISGLIGVFIAFIIVNWNRIDPNTKCFMICMVGFIVIFNILFSSGGSGSGQMDSSGHLGGMIVGVFYGMAIVKPNSGVAESYETKVKQLGYILTFVYFLVCLILLFTS